MKIASFIYISFFLFATIVLIIRTKYAATSHFKNAFWALTAFSIMELTSFVITQWQSIVDMPANISILFDTFSIVTSVSSNIFLFHFGISILTYKTSTHIDYKIFPVLILLGYILLYFTGIFEPSEFEKVSKFSLGYNGSILGFVGCINLYLDKKKALHKNISLYGLILLGVFLLTYAITNGIIIATTYTMLIYILRVASAGMFAVSVLMLNDIMKEESAERISFV